MGYLTQIRKFCVDCMGGQPSLVSGCPSTRCKFYPYRMGKNIDLNSDFTPLKSIRLYCLECLDNSSEEIRNCSLSSCPIYKYRFGTNPKRKGIGNKNPNMSGIPFKVKDENDEII